MRDDRAALDDFGGVVRLFPLPNLVHFPHVDQGLHIFEPRYRQMAADALAGDRLIAMVLLKPDDNWDEGYDGRPPIEGTACLGRVTACERLPDGRYNLTLRGLARLRVAAELPDPSKLYRLARGELLTEVCPPDLGAVSALRRELRDGVLARFAAGGPAHTQLAALFAGDTPLGAVCDLLGYSLPLPLGVKQRLLDTPAVADRARLLLDSLGTAARKRRPFPPPFSPN
jgi:Lon protease-like protein